MENNTVDTELSLLVDISGSVMLDEYELQLEGYAQVFDDPDLFNNAISQNQEQEIAVNLIVWSGSNQQQESVPWTLIDSVESSQDFAGEIRETLLPSEGGIRPFDDNTAPGSAIDFADDKFASNDFDSDRQVIDISGDGVGSPVNTANARDNALALGIDRINGIVIGNDANVFEFYEENVKGGVGEGDDAPFVLQVDEFSGFADRVDQKIKREVDPEQCEGVSWGDVHIVTFDDRNYDFQAEGEFILVESVEDNSEDSRIVQVRQELGLNSDKVSINTAFATEFGDDTVVFDLDLAGRLKINGIDESLDSGDTIDLRDDNDLLLGNIQRFNNEYTFTYAGDNNTIDQQDDTLIALDTENSINLEFRTIDSNLQGLLGSKNGNPDDDLYLRDGTENDTVNNQFAESWQVTSDESLFSSRSELILPADPASIQDFSPEEVERVRQLVADATDENSLAPEITDGIVLDVLATGEESFIDSALETFATNDNSLVGTEGDDNLTGTDGNDTLNGGGGNDEILGENGNDLLQGGDDDDTLLGGNDQDDIFGNEGNDSIQGGNGDDTVFGGVGNDSIFGSSGNDRLSGDEGDDLINGDDGNDEIFGGTGQDTLSGNEGNDVIFAQAGDDTVSGGNGIDTLSGNDGDDFLKGGAGDDRLTGDAGSDTFSLAIGEGTDTITDFEQGTDVIDLPSGIDFNSRELDLFGNDIILNGEILATVNISADNLTESDFV